MSEISVIFDSDTSRTIYSLAQNLPPTDVRHKKHLEDQIWNTFGLKIREKPPVNSKFKSHPKPIDSDSDMSLHADKHAQCSDSETEVTLLFSKDQSYFQKNLEIREVNNNARKQNISKKDEEEQAGNVAIRKKLQENISCISHQRIRSCGTVDSNKSIGKKNMKTKSSAEIILNHKTYLDSKQEPSRSASNEALKIGSKFSKETATDNTDQKLKMFLQRIINVLDDISTQLDVGVPLPDGAEDFARRKKRSVEFSSRFSRNYLYQLGRQLMELVKVTSKSGRISVRATGCINQQLIGTHQIILQALQAYHSHMPTSIINGVPEKLVVLLKRASELCQVHVKHLSRSPNVNTKRESLVNIFETKSKTLLDKLREYTEFSTVSLLRSSDTRLSLPGPNMKKIPPWKKKCLQARYSMYSMPHKKEAYWKKSASALAKQKFNVQSKYKTATFKHRPALEKPVLIQLPDKNLYAERRSSVLMKNSPLPMAVNENEIVTMIQAHGSRTEVDLNVKEVCDSPVALSRAQSEILQRLYQQVCKENEDMSQEKVENILSGLLGMVRSADNDLGEETGPSGNYKEQLEKMARDMLVDNLGRPIKDESCSDIVSKLVAFARGKGKNGACGKKGQKKTDHKNKTKNRRNQHVTVTGEKNAQLICIRDDDSIVESSNRENQEMQKKSIKATSETQTDMQNCCNQLIYREKEICTENTSRTNIKISRLPKPCVRKLELIPKNNAIDIIQYKLTFHKYTKGNHMYRKSNTVKPWLIVGKVSDNLLDYLLLTVAQEIEVSDILETLYEAEFR